MGRDRRATRGAPDPGERIPEAVARVHRATSLPEATPGHIAGAPARIRILPWGIMRAMADERRPSAAPLAPTTRRSRRRSATATRKDRAQLARRLARIEGQVRGIARMIEREEYCVDILQQTSALRAAVDALSILILEDHVSGCVRTAAEQGDADRYVEEVVDVVRRTLGRPVRTGRVG